MLTALGLLLCAYVTLAFDRQSHFHGTPPTAVPDLPIGDHRANWVRDLSQRWDISNLGVVAVRVGHGQEWTYVETITHGNRSLDEDGPLLRNHTFAIASNTKVITGIALSLLMEDMERINRTLPNGEPLSFKTKMKDILPGEWVLQDHSLLAAMHWGMPRHDSAHKIEAGTDFSWTLNQLKLSAELREAWQYQNGGYNLVPLIFHHMLDPKSPDTLKAFTSYVQERLFDALGLSAASYNFEQARSDKSRVEGAVRMRTDMVACHREFNKKGMDGWRADGREIPSSCLGDKVGIGAFTDLGTGSDTGAGGITMDMWTMAFWVWRLLDPFDWLEPHVRRVVTPLALERSHEPIPLPEGDLRSPKMYGIGQEISTYRGVTIHEHTGSLPGQTSWLVRLPSKGKGLWLQSGDPMYGVKALQAIGWTIIDDWLEVPDEARVDWEEQLMVQPLAQPAKQTGLPANPVGSPEADEVAAAYRSDPYGTMFLHPYGEGQTPSVRAQMLGVVGPSSLDASGGGRLNLSQLLVADMSDKLFYSHIAFTPWSGRIYNWTTLDIYPREALYKAPDGTWQRGPLGGHQLAGSLEEMGSAVITDQGIGMFGNWWGGARELMRWPDRSWEHKKGDDKEWIELVKERAEVWFERRSWRG